MFKETSYDRRQFLGTTALRIAATQLGLVGSVSAQSNHLFPLDVHHPLACYRA